MSHATGEQRGKLARQALAPPLRAGNFQHGAFKGKGRYTWFEGSVLYAEWAKGEPIRDSRFAGVDGTRLYDIVYKAGAVISASRLVLPHGAGEVRQLTAEASGTKRGGGSKALPGDSISTGGPTGNARLARAAAVQDAAREEASTTYAYYADPRYGVGHCQSACGRVAQVPLLALPAVLVAATIALDFAAFATAYTGTTCRMTNPQTRSCFGQEPGTCCKGEEVQGLGFAVVSLLLLAASLATAVLYAVSKRDLTIGAALPSVLHSLGLSPVWHAVRLIWALRTPRTLSKGAKAGKAQSGSPGEGPARTPASRAPVMSLGLGKTRGRSNTSFKEANPMGDVEMPPSASGGQGGDTAGRGTLSALPGPLTAVSTSVRAMLETTAPWLFTGVSRAQLHRVAQHCVPALLLHAYGLFGLWTFEDVPPLEAAAAACGVVVLWWTLVASDLGGITMKSLRFILPPPDTPLWKDPKMPSLFVRESPHENSALWLTLAAIISGLFRAMELLSRLAILGGVLAATKGVLLALLLPGWLGSYYLYAAWSYPRERDYETRERLKAWALPHWPSVRERQAAEAAGGVDGTGGTLRRGSSDAGKVSPKRPATLEDSKAASGAIASPPAVPGKSSGGLKGGSGAGRGGGARASDSVSARPPTSPREKPSSTPTGTPTKPRPSAGKAGSDTAASCPMRTRHCFEACGVRCWDCLRPGLRDASVWWWERAISPMDPRLLISLVAFPAPNWSPLFPTVASVGAPLTARFPVWSYFASRAAEDILGILLFAATQRYGENPVSSFLESSALGMPVRAWCCRESLWLLLVVCTLVKYILLPFYLNLFQVLAQPPLEEDGEDVQAQSTFSFAWWRKVDPRKVPDWATEALPGQAGYKSAHRPSTMAAQVLSPSQAEEEKKAAPASRAERLRHLSDAGGDAKGEDA